VESKNYLEALDSLFEFEKKGVLREESEKLLESIKNKGGFIEDGLRGQHYYKVKKYEEALEYLIRYLEGNPEDIRGWKMKAQIYERDGKYGEAIDCYENLEDLTSDLSVYQKKAYCFYKIGDIKETIHCLDYIIKRDPHNPNAIEFKKSCLRDYRTDGFKKEHFRKKSSDDHEMQKRNRFVKIVEVSFLIVVIAGFLIYWIGKTERAINGLNSEDSTVKVKSIVTLRGNNSEDVIDALIKTLKDSNPGIRATTVRILGETGDKSIAEHIIPLLQDPDWSVRKTTVEVLGNLKEPLAIHPMVKLIENHDELDFIRLKALGSIEGINPEEIKPLLTFLLEDRDTKIRIYAVQYIDRFALKNYLPALKESFKKEMKPEVTEAIAKAISKFEE